MSEFRTFSKRGQTSERSDTVPIYVYDQLPRPFRVQVIHIWKEATGPYRKGSQFGSESPSAQFWRTIHRKLVNEHGLFHAGSARDNDFLQCQHYLLAADVHHALDLIELSFHEMPALEHYQSDRTRWQIFLSPVNAIKQLNQRFREHRLGYQFTNGQLVKVTSEYLHAEAVEPALRLLHDNDFRGAEEEFQNAHRHLLAGNYKEAVAEALKAFESTMKTICARRNWAFAENDTARKLLDIVLANELVPSYLQSQVAGLRASLEGLATLRNKTSGHGQGEEERELPEHFAAWALHMAGANIRLFIECDRER